MTAVSKTSAAFVRGLFSQKPKYTASRHLALMGVMLLAILIFVPEVSQAQEGAARIDQVSESFRDAVDGIATKLAAIARSLLMSLLLIELVWKLGKTVQAGDDFGQFMQIFFTRIVIAGLFLALIEGIPTGSGNVGIATFVIQSAEGLVGATTDGASIKPSSLFWQMFESGQKIYGASSGVSGTISAVIVWLLLCILGAVVVGLMIVTYIEIYVVFTVGILALGFGVWEMTEQFAKNFLFSAVAKIFKLFTMILMASVISLTIQAFGTLTSFEDGLITIGIVLIFAMLMTSVPQAVEQIISGIPAISSDAAVSSAITGAAQKGTKSVANKAGGAGKKALSAWGKALCSGAKKAGTALASRIRDIKKG